MFLRFRALLALALIALLCIGPASPAFAEALSFGALYVGQYDDADAEMFRSKLLAEGWRQEVWKTNNSSYTSMKPHHYHFTHGVDDKMTEAGDDCDFLYVSGHGWRHAKIPIYWAQASTSPYDSISADTQCVGGPDEHPWEIGVDWAGRYPSNESRWDSDIEWAIFAACNQLDYRTTSTRVAYSNAAPTNSSAKAWARTLLGEPSRMHAIFGYWDTAPAGSYDTYVISDFMNACLNSDSTLGTAWANANGRYGFSWAYVTHAANRLDRLQGHGAGVTPDTSPTSSYQIDYYRASLSGRILDGRGGAYETVSDASPHARPGVPDWLRRQFGIEAAVAAPGTTVRTGDREITLEREAETPRTALESRVAQVLIPEVELLVPGVRATETSVTSGGGRRALGTRSGEEGQEFATVGPDGSFEYHSGRGLGGKPAGISRERALATARAYLTQADARFADAQAAEISEVTRTSLDLDDGSDGDTEVVQYQVRFVQRADGAFVEGPGTGVTVVIDDAGVNAAFGRWVSSTALAQSAPAAPPVSAREALQRNGAELGRAVKVPDDVIRLRGSDVVWHLASGSTELRPAWRFETDEGATFFATLDGTVLIE
jgi:hypothetical protein